MATESCLPLFAEIAKEGPVEPGVYRLADESGNTVVRTIDTENIPDYDAVVTTDLFAKGNPTLSLRFRDAKRLFVVVDPAVHEVYGAKIEAYLEPCGVPFAVYALPRLTNNEENKSVESWIKLHTWLMEHRIGPMDLLIGIGGGVVGDLVGFTAFTARPGEIPYLLVTTTLTATIDAGISPKTGINVGGYKNSGRVVYPPRSVFCDGSFLKTDPSLKTGLAELVKLAIVRSGKLFRLLEREGAALSENRFQSPTGRNVIKLAQRLFLKMKFEPPFPGNRPASLRSFAHSFSRHLESRSGFMLTHGEAIGVEMAVAASLACERQVLPEPERDRIIALLAKLQLLPYCPECAPDEIWPLFERKVEAREPLFFPIPNNEIGRGRFLCNFSKAQLVSAINRVPQIRARESIAGRVEYLAEVRGAHLPVAVMADFFEDGSSCFKEQESGDVGWYRSEKVSPEEEIFAYRLLLKKVDHASPVFQRLRES